MMFAEKLPSLYPRPPEGPIGRYDFPRVWLLAHVHERVVESDSRSPSPEVSELDWTSYDSSWNNARRFSDVVSWRHVEHIDRPDVNHPIQLMESFLKDLMDKMT